MASKVPNPFPPELLNVPSGNKIMGDKAKYIKITGERRTSLFNKYGSPPRARALRDVSDAAMRLLHTFESFEIELTQVQNLHAFEQYVQDQGMDWLNYQLTEAAHRPMNTRITSLASVLRYGQIYIDVDGNLLPNSSGADVTVDFNIPATHQNQINGIIDVSWANNSANIPRQIASLQANSLQETGMPLTTALYGKNVLTYMTTNDYVLDYLSRHEQMRDSILRDNTIPPGLFGIKNWHPVWTSFFEDQNGVVQEIWDNDLCVMMPDISQPDQMNWWGAYEGSYPVPRKLEIQKNLKDPFANYELVYGFFGFALIRTDGVPGYKVFTGDTALFGPKNEKALYQIDTAF